MMAVFVVADECSPRAGQAGANREDSEVAESECSQDREAGLHGRAQQTVGG